MAMVKVSATFEVTLPREICAELKIVAGQELNIYVRDGFIRMSAPALSSRFAAWLRE
jgi:bifunctional DNA-binding transcriptional regulator/antitoxin component of YhaV-PrlF toxin-antitoxin module